MTRLEICILFWLSIVGCSSSIPHVNEVTELAPPLEAEWIIQNGKVRIQWRASPHEDRADFAGYNVYFSRKSLIFTAIKELPSPGILDKNQHQHILENLDETSPIFVHVRSRDSRGNVSLPSLPELKIYY